jgi:hypothetical protein
MAINFWIHISKEAKIIGEAITLEQKNWKYKILDK